MKKFLSELINPKDPFRDLVIAAIGGAGGSLGMLFVASCLLKVSC